MSEEIKKNKEEVTDEQLEEVSGGRKLSSRKRMEKEADARKLKKKVNRV